jgi:hypothetical protein
MNKSAAFLCVFLGSGLLLLSGCSRISSPSGVMAVKNLGDNQNQMQAQLRREEKLYDKLKADLKNGRLKALTLKERISRVYGEPTLCRPAEGDSEAQEACIYRKQAGGLLSEIILLNFDAQGKLFSWQVQD